MEKKSRYCSNIIATKNISIVPSNEDNEDNTIVVDLKDSEEGDDEIPDLSDHENPPDYSPKRPKTLQNGFKRLISASNAGIMLAKKKNENLSNSSKKSQDKISKPSIYHCDAGCNFSTKSIGTMSNHKDYFCKMKRNLEASKETKLEFTCDTCDFTTEDSRSYSKHIRKLHIDTSEKRYKCDQCNFKTFDKYSLIYHIEQNECNPVRDFQNDIPTIKDRKLLVCEFCDDFDANSPLEVIAHLKDFHILQAEDSTNKTKKRRKLGKKETEVEQEKIPIIQLERMKNWRDAGYNLYPILQSFSA